MRRALVLVLNGLGLGPSQDAECFDDCAADSLGTLCRRSDLPERLPNLGRMGLFAAYKLANGLLPDGCTKLQAEDLGAYAACQPLSSGKETLASFWELAGVPALFDWDYFQPQQAVLSEDLIRTLRLQEQVDALLGNCSADGLELIQVLGENHIATGAPIIYSSGDSLIQVAAHEQHFGLERLYRVCRNIRQQLDSPDQAYRIARVIARPFIGEEAGSFVRTPNRRDFGMCAPAATVLDKLHDSGGQVITVGRISDLYARQGIDQSIRACTQPALIDACLEHLGSAPDQSLIMANLLHLSELELSPSPSTQARLTAYAEALAYVDAQLPRLLDALSPGDLLIITADSGLAFTESGVCRTREWLPLLIGGPEVTPANLGRRSSLADIGQTLAAGFALPPMSYGQSLMSELFPHSDRHFP